MSLTLPQPAGLLRSKLETALASLVPEADRDEIIVSVLRAMNDVGFSIYDNGWLDDDEPLLAAFREKGLDSEGLPEDLLITSKGEEGFFIDGIDLDDDDNSGLPSSWPDDTGENR
jgi:hypothetical protein